MVNAVSSGISTIAATEKPGNPALKLQRVIVRNFPPNQSGSTLATGLVRFYNVRLG